WTAASRVRVKKNPNYWRPGLDGKMLPYLDEIEWRIIPDPQVQGASLETGQVDLIAAPIADLDKMEASNKYNFAKFAGSSWSGMTNSTCAADAPGSALWQQMLKKINVDV